MSAPDPDLHDCGGCGIVYPARWPRCPACRADRAVASWEDEESVRTVRGCVTGIAVVAVIWGLIIGLAYWLAH